MLSGHSSHTGAARRWPPPSRSPRAAARSRPGPARRRPRPGPASRRRPGRPDRRRSARGPAVSPRWGGANIGEPSGRLRLSVICMVPRSSRARSAPVKTARTPGAATRRRRVDRPDPRMGVRRAHEHRMGLAGQVDVVVEAALAAQQARVLEALDRLADAELAHQRHSRARMAHLTLSTGSRVGLARDPSPLVGGAPAWPTGKPGGRRRWGSDRLDCAAGSSWRRRSRERRP